VTNSENSFDLIGFVAALRLHKVYFYVNWSCEEANCSATLALSIEGLGSLWPVFT